MSKVKENRNCISRKSMFIIAGVLAIYIILLALNYYFSRRMILDDIRDNARNVTLSTLSKISTVLVSAEQMPQNLAYILDSTNFDQPTLLKMLKSLVENNKNTYGSAIAFEPYMFDKYKDFYSPYYYKIGNNLKFKDLAESDYRYIGWDWYKNPKILGKGVWSEPYFDKNGGGIFMVTYSMPFFRTLDGKKKLCGVITSDISLDWLENIVSQIKIFDTGYAFILSPKGYFISHPNKEYYSNKESIYSISDKYFDKNTKEIGNKMINGETGYDRYYSQNKNQMCYLYYTPIGAAGCSLGIVIPEGELLFKLNVLTLTMLTIGVISSFLGVIVILYQRKRFFCTNKEV